jgi:hypothetical protein
MTDNPECIRHITACDLVIGAHPERQRKRRRRSLASTLKAARKAGAGHVELVGNKVVIALAGEPSEPAKSPDPNEWDEVLPGGERGAH